MKINFIILLSLLSISVHASEPLEDKKEAIAQFLKEYPTPYQDIIVDNQTVLTGQSRCPERYKLLEPVLQTYKEKEFSILDIGAAQGYFTFKIAYEYPLAHCTMIEGGCGQGAYMDFPAQLLKLCNLNSNLKHITFLNKPLVLNDLIALNQKEHFDIVLAFLVLHLFSELDYNHTLEDRKISLEKILDNIVSLGDNVVLEVVPSRKYHEFVQVIKSKYNVDYLGQVMRDYRSPNRVGVLWWFKNKKTDVKNTLDISDETYNHFSGVYRKK